MSSAQDRASLEWVRGTTLTLRGLLDQSGESPTIHDGPVLPESSPRGSLEQLRLPNSAFANFTRSTESDGDDDSFVPVEEEFDTLQLGSRNGALSISSEESSSADNLLANREQSCLPTVICRSLANERDSDDSKNDNDDNFEPLNVAEFEDGNQEKGTDVEPRTSAIVDSAKEGEDDDNLWLKVGGGLALVGAVVAGGVALANAQNGGDDRRRRNSREDVPISNRASS